MPDGPTTICNLALSYLGRAPIASLLDKTTAGLVMAVEYDPVRRLLLGSAPTWRFSVKRASLAALSAVPISGPFTAQYQMPPDCLKPLQIGDTWCGLDLSDYRLGPTDLDYSIEGRAILCDYGSPLSFQYAADVVDTTTFDPPFIIYFAAQLAYDTCERLTNSTTKQADCIKRRDGARREATRAGALFKPPDQRAEDTWIAARLQ